MQRKPINQIYPGLAKALFAIEDARKAFVAEVALLPKDGTTADLLGKLADVDDSLARAESDLDRLFDTAFQERLKDRQPTGGAQ